VRKIKEVLRLHALGLSQRQIALSCAVGQATVSDYLKAAETVGLKWAEVADWDDDRLWKAVAPSQETPRNRIHPPEPDYAAILRELQTHKHVTLQLLWEEYREQSPDGYRYSRYCDLYRAWLQRQEVVLRHEHRAGEKLFVDYAGDTIPIYSAVAGEVWPAALFVAVLGASSYTYAEASLSQGLADWIGAHMRAFEFMGGVPEIVVPDNLKSGVTKACRYEPSVNRTYEEMAAHYSVAVVPARPLKPRDKDYVSYCTLSWLCRGEGRLLGRSASLAFENGVLVQRFVETSPDIVVMMLLQQPLSSPSIDCSERHTVPHAHLFRRE